MKNIRAIRKAVCIIANNLRKAGYTLSEAFRMAWHRVRETRFRVAGTMADNRQARLAFMEKFPLDDLQAAFRREPGNQYDKNAVQVLVKIKSRNIYTVIGYVPAKIAEQIAPAIDQGIRFHVYIRGIIGGYDYKENRGLLLDMAV